ncbi:MAG: thioredoxin [Cytophagales bacterium]|nr:MAG: thioredoxin [Cytophagales bacterium]TAF59962.1 MAG: thioredoxin [Cytophagales bacterium]
MSLYAANDDNFKDFLANHSKIVVKFYAPWCGTCRLLAPKFKQWATELAQDGVVFLNVNAGDSPLTRRHAGLFNLPFTAFYKNGQLYENTDSHNESYLQERIAHFLSL